MLGRFDQLIITQSDNAHSLFPQQARSITNARAATSSSHIGRVIGAEDFDPCVWAQTHPMVGLCSVRFSRRVLAAAGSFEFLDEFLHRRLQGTEVRHCIVSATGWEDALVLFFARDFNSISRAAGVLRSMKIADLPALKDKVKTDDGFTHPCLTTSTLPAFCCQWSGEWTEADTGKLLARVAADEPLHWAVRIELHPGHWDGFARELEKKSAELGVSVVCRPTFGQTDLRVSADGAAATHAGLLRFLLHVIFPLGADPETVMRSAETHLHPVLEAYGEDAGATFHVDQKISLHVPHEAAFPEEIREKLRGVAIPPHMLRVLEETLGRVQGMSQDPLHGEEFETLQRLRTAFIKTIRRMPPSISEKASRQLQLDMSEWQMLLDRCLADRFRGPYPVGDSMMMRLGSYQGAHHRFLVVADQISQMAYELARHCIKDRNAECVLPDVAIATFIGNSSSPYATSHTINDLGCGFTDVPATLICRLSDGHMLAHETGHHIVRAFFAALPELGFDVYYWDPVDGLSTPARQHLIREGLTLEDVDLLSDCWKSSETLREMRELLAEYFSFSLCFPGNQEAYKRVSRQCLASFYEGGSELYLRSLQTEVGFRALAIQSLTAIIQGQPNTYSGDSNGFIARINRDFRPATDLGPVIRRSQFIGRAIGALEILLRTKDFSALLRGIADCAAHDTFPGEAEDASLLKELRAFLVRLPAVSLEDNISFLDSLWFKLLRRREKKHLMP
ncbi:MAG: hypothetical protein J0L73_24790 [Verrucomicrobia bacterium]|nr:hypothetical protein [Verrucomicrobiota bacterium]